MNGIKQKINKKSLIATVVWYLKLCTTFAMVSFPVSLFQQDLVECETAADDCWKTKFDDPTKKMLKQFWFSKPNSFVVEKQLNFKFKAVFSTAKAQMI